MPTIYREGPYRFFFYSGDKSEPAHIHIERDKCTAKVWLEPVRLHTSGGFARAELSRIIRIINGNKQMMLEAWNDYFGS